MDDTSMSRLVVLLKIYSEYSICAQSKRNQTVYSRISSFVALRDRDGLPGGSSLPYFFLFDVPFVVDEDDSVLSSLLTDALKVLALFDDDA